MTIKMTSLNKIIKVALVSILLLSVPQVNHAQEVLDNYLKIAAENNPRLKSLFRYYLAALEKMPQVRALPDPQVAFGVFVSPVETRVGPQQATISVSQMFPWFGQLKAQERVEAQVAQARFQSFEDAKNRLFFDVKTTYNNLYVLQAAIEINRENIRLLETFRELANVKFESGKGSLVDVLRIEMETRELENQIDFLEDSLIPLNTRFEELLNTKLDGPVIYPDTLWEDDVVLGKAAIYDSIITQNPSLKRFDHEILSLENQVEVARKLGMPSFSVGLNYINVSERKDVEIPDNGKDALMLPLVGIRIPLYRNKYKAMVKEKQIHQESVQFAKEDTANKLLTELDKGYRDYLDADRRLPLYLNLVEIARQSLDIMVAEYTSAGIEFEEILRMGRQLLKYELELETARADQNTSVAFIDYLMAK